MKRSCDVDKDINTPEFPGLLLDKFKVAGIAGITPERMNDISVYFQSISDLFSDPSGPSVYNSNGIHSFHQQEANTGEFPAVVRMWIFRECVPGNHTGTDHINASTLHCRPCVLREPAGIPATFRA